MYYANIKTCDIANGPGIRTTLFVSGCRRHCPFCFNQQAALFDYGESFTSETMKYLLDTLCIDYVDGLTLLGGEPMERENQPTVRSIIETVRNKLPQKSIWLYSGFTYEELIGKTTVRFPYEQSPVTCDTMIILSNIDVLVDGPFVNDLHDLSLRFRGSQNQRLIDMQKTIDSGKMTLWEDDQIYITHSI